MNSSKIINNSEDNNSIIYILLAFLSIAFLPIFIITFSLTLFLKHKKVKKIFPSIILMFILFITNLVTNNQLILTFSQDYIKIIENIINNKNIYSITISLFNYSTTSWILIICISISISFILAYEINKETNNIIPLENELENINKNISKKVKNINLNQDIENKTIIGMYGKKVIATEDNAKHIFVCGTTGSGKTVLLGNYIENAINKNYPLLLVDGKGDIGQGSISDIVKKFSGKRKVYIIDMNNPETSDKYNPFIKANSTVCKDMIVNMTDWSEEHYKVNAERYMQRVTKLLNIAEIELSFDNIINYLNTENLMLLSRNLESEKKISKSEHLRTLEIIKSSAKIAQDATARFSIISESELGIIFQDGGIDIYNALKENAIILFILNPLSYPELSKLLGRLIIIDAKKAVSNLFNNNNKRIFFIFDEINVYASHIFIDLINKSRSANITCISATQSLADLEYNVNDAFKQQMIENCNNYLVMRQNSAKSAEEWAEILGTYETLEITYKMGNNKNINKETGHGSAKKVRKFLYHPDEIKGLKTGTAIYMSKDLSKHYKINVRKGF